MAARLRVPASSANLGPGFDSLGLALDLHLECDFEAAATWDIRAGGCDCDRIPCDPSNLICKTAASIAASAGRELPPLRIAIQNEIPLGKGLGSSAAALTAGVVIASDVLQLQWDRRKVFEEAARLEGHPDNVAACVFGGVTASAMDEHGSAHAVSFALPSSIGVSVVVPDFVLPTHEARAALPDCYSRADAIYNVQRTALLIAALATGDISALTWGLGDRMHQPFRAPLVPGLAKILALQNEGLFGCVLSGAGPSVLVFHELGAGAVCEVVRAIFAEHGRSSECLVNRVAPSGFSVTPL